MKTILAAIALMISGTLLAADLSQPYTPTRAEWLQTTIYQEVNHLTDMWKLRISTSVRVINKDQKIFVLITESNGQESTTPLTKESYMKDVASMIRSLIKEIEWAKDLRVEVKFI
jgi:hypothetical protein